LINHHFIGVRASSQAVFDQLLLWGEAPWWPKDSPMQYERLTGGEVGMGSRYRQKITVPFGPAWDVEIESVVDGRAVTYRFINGMFKGVYRLYVIPTGELTEAHFLMDYEVVGGLNRFLWDRLTKKKHDRNLARLLRALKGYLEGSEVTGDEEDEHPATPQEADRRRFLQGFVKRR